MRIVCRECGMAAKLDLGARNRTRLVYPPAMPRVCPVVAARLEASGGTLDGDAMDCPHLEAAADAALTARRAP